MEPIVFTGSNNFDDRNRAIEAAILGTGGQHGPNGPTIGYEQTQSELASMGVSPVWRSEVAPESIMVGEREVILSAEERQAWHRQAVAENDALLAQTLEAVNEAERRLLAEIEYNARTAGSLDYTERDSGRQAGAETPRTFVRQRVNSNWALRAWMTILVLWVLFGGGLLIAGCANGKLADQEQRQESVPETEESLATPELAQLVMAPVPTTDRSLETVVAQLAAQSAADREAALGYRETAVVAQAQLVQATAEFEQRELEFGQLTAVVEGATRTAYPTSVPLTLQAQNTADALLVLGATQQIIAATGTAYAPTQVVAEAQAAEEAKQMPVIVLMEALSPLLLLLACVVVVAPFTYVFLKSGRPSSAPETKPEASDDIRRIRLELLDAYGWGSLKFSELPISWKELSNVAELIVENHARYTQAQMTGAGKPLVKDGNFNEFGQWLVKNGVAYQHEDGRYQIIHPEFFERVLIEKA